MDIKVGPDLNGLSHRSVEDLLSHIIDPNMAINPNYVSCVVETIDNTVQADYSVRKMSSS